MFDGRVCACYVCRVGERMRVGTCMRDWVCGCMGMCVCVCERIRREKQFRGMRKVSEIRVIKIAPNKTR